MFYCEECRKEKDWPRTLFFKSEGSCEVCGKHAVCHDVPSLLIEYPEVAEKVEQKMRNNGSGAILDKIRDDTITEEDMEVWSKEKGYE